MAARVDGQRGGPTVDSAVSVADLIARDAPWAGDPHAVDVGRPAVPAQRSSSPGEAGAKSAGTAGAKSAGTAGAKAAGKSTARPAALQAFAARALGPQWRFVTGAAAVLVAGLLGNVIMVAVMSGPRTQLAQSEDGGYPAEQVTEPPAALPLDAAPARSFTLPGVGLPLALASLAQSSVPATNRAAAPAALPTALVGGVNSTTAPGGTGTSVPARSGSSSAGGTLGGTGVLGDTAGSVGGALPVPLGSPVKELGKTTSKTTSELGRTVESLGDGLLGNGSRKSSGSDEDRDSGDSGGSSDSDSGERSSGDRSESSSSGGLLEGVGSLLGN